MIIQNIELADSSANYRPLHELPQSHFPLAEAFYRSHKYKIRLGRQERVFTLKAEEGGEIIAAARLLSAGEQGFWLRNLLVAKASRGTGVGRALMKAMLAAIQPAACYCFALPEVKAFYLTLDFYLPDLHSCPAEIQQQYLTYRNRGRDWVLMAYDSTAAC